MNRFLITTSALALLTLPIYGTRTNSIDLDVRELIYNAHKAKAETNRLIETLYVYSENRIVKLTKTRLVLFGDNAMSYACAITFIKNLEIDDDPTAHTYVKYNASRKELEELFYLARKFYTTTISI